MRLVNLYAGDEHKLGFAEDVGSLVSHIEEIERSSRWESVDQISQGINHITASVRGNPLSPDGIRGIQQLICKVSSFSFIQLILVHDKFDHPRFSVIRSDRYDV
jgi:hypothetical protein